MPKKGYKQTEKHKKQISIKAKHRLKNSKNCPFFGKHHTKASKEKISKANKGKKLSKAHKKKISLANKGRKGYWAGKKRLAFRGKNHPHFGKVGCWAGKKRPEISGKKNGMFGKPTPHSKRIYYKGTYFRSSWEAKFAQFLDLSGYKWLFESKTFDLGNMTYTPDFYLPEFDCYVEIKGWWRWNDKKRFNLFKTKYSKVNIKVLMQKELQELGII